MEEGFEEKWYEKPLSNFIDMPVPASYNDITTDKELRDHVGWVWYETDAVIPRAWTKDQRIVIRFGSVTQHAVVYLNGEEIARHKGGFLPFEADITDKVHEGKNRLTVAVSNLLDWSCIPSGEYKFVKTGFIQRDIGSRNISSISLTILVSIVLFVSTQRLCHMYQTLP